MFWTTFTIEYIYGHCCRAHCLQTAVPKTQWQGSLSNMCTHQSMDISWRRFRLTRGAAIVKRVPLSWSRSSSHAMKSAKIHWNRESFKKRRSKIENCSSGRSRLSERSRSNKHSCLRWRSPRRQDQKSHRTDGTRSSSSSGLYIVCKGFCLVTETQKSESYLCRKFEPLINVTNMRSTFQSTTWFTNRCSTIRTWKRTLKSVWRDYKRSCDPIWSPHLSNNRH